MHSSELVKMLVSTDELQNWGLVADFVRGQERRDAFAQATPLWIERMVSEWKLFLHPDVVQVLRDREWDPTDTHRKMIWASIVCKLDRPEDKAEKDRIKALLKKKYDHNWWEDVYRRAGQVYPAWSRAKKKIFTTAPGVQMMAAHSSVLGLAFAEEFERALRMVPAE